MRGSELLAYAIYLADYHASDPREGRPLLTWDELTYQEQEMYKLHGEAALKHLFEHGRIASLLSAKRLEALRVEYRTYLERNKVKQ